MLKDLKLGFRLLKYSYSFKLNMGLLIFMVVLSLLLSTFEIDSFVFGGIYGFIGTLVMIQMSTSLLFSQLCAASPKKKYLELGFSNMLSTVGALFWYLILAVMSQVLSHIRPQLRDEYSVALVNISIFIVISMLYYGICYKYFVVGTILFVIFFVSVYSMGDKGISILIRKGIGTDFITTFVTGLVILLIGCVLSCLLRRLLYRKTLSPYSMGADLRKAMQ